MIYELAIDFRFRASHALTIGEGEPEPIHAHDWQGEVIVRRASLDADGLVIDFHVLQDQVGRAIDDMRDANLNELSDFADANPSAERVAEMIARRLGQRLPDEVELVAVTVTEAHGCRATFRCDR